MRQISFNPSFKEWQMHARQALREGLIPEQIAWEATQAAQPALALFNAETSVPDDSLKNSAQHEATFRVPREFMELARRVSCHRDERRWTLLYRVLWRLTHGSPQLLQVPVDKDVYALAQMDRAVRRDVHKMRAFVRFREVTVNPASGTHAPSTGNTGYVAWFEPEHFIVELNAAFFRDRFANLHWSILTPDRCVHWNGTDLSFTEGVAKDSAPDGDAMERLWRTYYSSIFNPARVKTKAMKSEMPVKYWKNLPEASLIPSLVNEAPERVHRMMEKSSVKHADKRITRKRNTPASQADG